MTRDDRMRRLVAYDGWHAPAELAATVCGGKSFAQRWVWGTTWNRPADQLWLFTSGEAVMVAQSRFAARTGSGFGTYVGPVAGPELFASLSRRVHAIVVDVVGVDGWVLEGPAVDEVRRWGLAVKLERALERHADDLVVQLIGYDHFTVIARPGEPAIAFTAPDAGHEGERMTGRELMAHAPGGLVINPSGPGRPYRFAPGACAAMAELAAAVAEHEDEVADASVGDDITLV